MAGAKAKAVPGAWKSPVGADLLTKKFNVISSCKALAEGVHAITELRPAEAGRVCVYVRGADGVCSDLFPPPFNARTRVHEYGGACTEIIDVSKEKKEKFALIFSNFSDQRLYAVTFHLRDGRCEDVSQPAAITSADNSSDRYGNFFFDIRTGFLFSAFERHSQDGKVENSIIAADMKHIVAHLDVNEAGGGGVPTLGEHYTLSLPSDFATSPALHPTSNTLVYISWDHPNMPWDETRMVEVEFELKEGRVVVGRQEVIRGGDGKGEAVKQPRFHPSGALFFVTDKSSFWQIYRREEGKEDVRVTQGDFDAASPSWTVGTSNYSFIGDGALLCRATIQARTHLILVEGVMSDAPTQTELACEMGDVMEMECARVGEGKVALTFVASSPAIAITAATAVIEGEEAESQACAYLKEVGVQLSQAGEGAGKWEEVARQTDLDRQEVEGYEGYRLNDFFTSPTHITYPSAGGRQSHALLYLPQSPVYESDGSLPPLLVKSHGGPTSNAASRFNLSIQFWTSRGFAVADVNYGGSTGYGREYRNLLKGRWGEVDVEDCSAVASYLAKEGKVDSKKLAIDGGSAGGYTTLACLTFTDVFCAGASHYGIASLMSLAEDTHKFESRYLDSLIGPFPERKDLYEKRSPINHIDTLSCPVALFQGLEDKVVPPNQATLMRDTLLEKGLPVACVLFEGEQHGFRQAQNIKKALNGELYFYSRVFGFDVDVDDVDKIDIQNLA